MMVLWEVKEALNYLLDENQEIIIIKDTLEVFAEDVVFNLELLFKSLKSDY